MKWSLDMTFKKLYVPSVKTDGHKLRAHLIILISNNRLVDHMISEEDVLLARCILSRTSMYSCSCLTAVMATASSLIISSSLFWWAGNKLIGIYSWRLNQHKQIAAYAACKCNTPGFTNSNMQVCNHITSYYTCKSWQVINSFSFWCIIKNTDRIYSIKPEWPNQAMGTSNKPLLSIHVMSLTQNPQLTLQV